MLLKETWTITALLVRENSESQRVNMKSYYFIYRDKKKKIKTSIAVYYATTEEQARQTAKEMGFNYRMVSWLRYKLFRLFGR